MLSLILRSTSAALCIACALVANAAYSAPGEPGAAGAQLFDYDRSQPIPVTTVSSTVEDGITVSDAHYPAYGGTPGDVTAYIVRPTGQGPFAGIVFFHWLGDPHGDRTEFLAESEALAKRGVVSLLIQGCFPWKIDPKDGPTDRRRIIAQTIEARRALDVLLAQPGVDAKRVAYVGHDYGAMYGAIVAGVDDRAKAFVLMTGMRDFSGWSLKYWPATGAGGAQAYRDAVADVSPGRFIGKASHKPVLFQFADRDIYISKAEALAFYDLARKPKEVRHYPITHDLTIDAARNDRDAWLTKQLGIGS